MEDKEKRYCYNCDKKVEFKTSKSVDTFNVKNCEVEAEVKHIFCKDCGEELYDADIERENTIRIYDAYKQKNGLLTSEQIKRIRDIHHLSQKKLADLLRTGEKTITRYENGAIQDPSYDLLLRILQNENGYYLLNHINDDNFESIKFESEYRCTNSSVVSNSAYLIGGFAKHTFKEFNNEKSKRCVC